MIHGAGIQKNVVFTANFLRFPHGHFTFRILCRLLNNPIKHVIGNCPSVYFPDYFSSNNRQYLNQLATLGIAADTAWVAFHEDSADLPEMVRVALHSFSGLVIGFEIPPSICRWLSNAGVPYLSFFIHPVRFLPDLLFAVSTNSKYADRVLAKWSVDIDVAFEYANVLRALCIGDMPDQTFIQTGSALFIGQTAHDASIVRNGEMISPHNCINELQTLAERYPDMLISPHPLERITTMVNLLRLLKCGTLVNQNSYSLLSHESIDTVITLSSSLGVEARFFGKNAIFLLGEPLRPGGPLVSGDASVHAVGHCILSTAFWAQLLGFADPEKTAAPGNNNLFKAPNLFRSLFGGWAYDQLDPVLRCKTATEKTSVPARSWSKIAYRELYPDRLSKINFQASGNSLLVAGDGFYDADDHGAWTDGHYAELLLPATAISACTGIHLRLHAFINLLSPLQRVTVKVNDSFLGNFYISSQGEHHAKIRLPSPEASRQYCKVQFELPDAKSPLELGISKDPRKLGLRFVEAVLLQEYIDPPVSLVKYDSPTDKDLA
jgi:hypothetical protein